MKKFITDEKTIYLVKTFSRTKRKDYENYVVNAIWNRIDKRIRPVTQQYVSNPNDIRKHYFIDLYFPSINLGIECDEAYHKQQKDKDKTREITIYDELHKLAINNDHISRVDVTLPFDEIDRQINEIVCEINQKAASVNLSEDWSSVLCLENYFKNRSKISTSDRVIFKTHNEINRLLFNSDTHPQKGGYIPTTFKVDSFFSDYMIWYPKLEMNSNTTWANTLSEDGNVIIERSEKIGSHDKGLKKIVFAKDKDFLNINGYKFIGVFQPVNYELVNSSVHTWTYKKISDECPIIR